MKEKKAFKADILLIAAVLLVGGIIAAVILLPSKTGNQVTVRVDGKVIAEYPLSDSAVREINGAEDGVNILRIEDGSAWIEEADCRDGLCVNMGKIRLVGQSIVCLPHKVVVEITDSQNRQPEIDVYAQ